MGKDSQARVEADQGQAIGGSQSKSELQVFSTLFIVPSLLKRNLNGTVTSQGESE